TVAINTDMDVDSTGGNEVAEAKKVAVVAKNVDAAKKAAKAKEAHKAKEAGKSKEAAGGKSADDKTLRKLKKSMVVVLNFRRILVSL
ncbi:hypothetical protein H4S04_008867, partial [Coemansia sp. S16]